MFVVEVREDVFSRLLPHIRYYIMDLVRDIEVKVDEVDELLQKSTSLYRDEYRQKLEELKRLTKKILNDTTQYYHPDFLIEELEWISDELSILIDILREDEDTS